MGSAPNPGSGAIAVEEHGSGQDGSTQGEN